MSHIKSDQMFILACAMVLVFAVAGIGFAIGNITRTPVPNPTPIPTPTPELKAGISDYASLFAKMDKNLFSVEQYHTLLERLTDCLPNLTSEFRAEFTDTTLSEGETAALLHFLASTAGRDRQHKQPVPHPHYPPSPHYSRVELPLATMI